jgi:cytochrome b pre-mRNA-processing protein 3
MIPPLFQKPCRTIVVLYGAIVAQARDPRFYEAYGVSDTVQGRLDMVILHLALALRRMREGNHAMRGLAQAAFDEFCRDVDHNLREMGISDPGVPHQMQKVGEAFYGRARAYDAALNEDGEDTLAQALIRNVYAGAPGRQVAARQLAAYVRQVMRMLDTQPPAELVQGIVRFPAPVDLPAAAAE